MQNFRFHCVALPHTQTTREYSLCSYTQKVRNFCNMMKSLGHTVFLYASDDNEAECDELISIYPKEDQARWFGDYDWKSEFFNISWEVNAPHWVEGNRSAVEEISKRIQPQDFICLIGGLCQKPIADAFPSHMSVEVGIGYTGTFSKYRVFESYPHMAYCSGSFHDDDGHFFDTVIPNYFDPDEFPVQEQKEDYFLFIGRLIPRKGPEIAVEATKRLGAKLVMAGQGVAYTEPGRVVASDGMVYEGDHIEHIGSVGVKERAELMGKARGAFVPTTYLEPFGGVSIESLMCGTPVIASNFGCFPTTIQHGKDGFLFSTIGEAVWAAKNVGTLDFLEIAIRARQNYSTDRVKWLYQSYFEQLFTLWGDGFYSDWDNGIRKYDRYVRYYG